ncbi:HK97 family phage prohead protease [Falsigemmobacter intermedius]|uniref:HK97 family phage prohead protease n=1 Tax=Falsigemmobacter intermedius TaxID=1553448 RepID=UPI003EFBD985
MDGDDLRLERKFMTGGGGLAVGEEGRISGYASLFGRADQGGDIVLPGAYAASLAAMERSGGRVKMLWQHDPAQPVGIWEEIAEDARGLRVSGRLLPEVARAREARALIAAGALDGLSIGYRTVKSSRDTEGRRLLAEVDLWEISLVTFPMQREARIEAKTGDLIPYLARLTGLLAGARQQLGGQQTV